MLTEIFMHTPKWVFFVFAGLLWFGARQLIANRVSLNRVTLMPIVMTALAVLGVTSAFRDSAFALLAWAAAAAITLLLMLQRPVPQGTRYDPATRRFHVAGSALPLALMMGIFFTKYAVGAALGMHPELHRDPVFALAIPVLYGAFSGVFMGRALRLWKVALRDDRALARAGSL